MKKRETFLERQFGVSTRRQQIFHDSGTGVSFLDRQTLELPIRAEHAHALALTDGSTLYSTLLVKNAGGRRRTELEHFVDMEPPVAMLVATPVPPLAWGRGLRICFTPSSSSRGQLKSLVAALTEAGLYVRRIDAANGLSMDRYAVATAGHELEPLMHGDNQRLASQPTIIATVELPIESEVADDAFLTSVFKYVQSWMSSEPALDDAPDPKAIVVKALADKLSQFGCHEMRVEWLSPLQTLTSLAQALPRDSQRLSDICNPVLIRRSVALTEALSLPLDKWKRTLDPGIRTSIEKTIDPGKPNLCAVVSVDSEERTLTAAFVPVEQYAVVQFEVVHPAGRLEHRWKQWILEEIDTHGGGVLHTFSQGRIDERWACELIVCYFPFADHRTQMEGPLFSPSVEKIRKITSCLAALQGFPRDSAGELILPDSTDEQADEAKSDTEHHDDDTPLQKLYQYCTVERAQMAARTMPGMAEKIRAYSERNEGSNPLAAKQRWDSTLRAVKLWYRWPSYCEQDYRKQYRKCAFSFTRPMNAERYKALYDVEFLAHERSRVRLVERIRDRLLDENDGSALLLGAPRSGKTSVMNMVLDRINSEDGEHALAIRLNATVMPPHLLIPTIIREIVALLAQREREDKAREDQSKGPVAKSAQKASGAMTNMAQSVVDAFKNVFGAEITEIDLKVLKLMTSRSSEAPDDVDGALSARELAATWTSKEGRAAFLRATIQKLRDVVRGIDPKIRLVVGLDEVSASAAWGNKMAFPVWRHLIESDDFGPVRWLISSTRPLSEAVGYSPLGNAVREYSLRPLSDTESRQLLRNFEATGDGKSGIVITHAAKDYLMWVSGRFPYFLQMLCVHLYERMVGYHIPVISTSLVRHVIRDKVIAELSDYFTNQQKLLDDNTLDALRTMARSVPNPLKYSIHHDDQLPPMARRAIQRVGLGWPDGDCALVPLYAYWLVNSVVEGDNDGAQSSVGVLLNG